jgi:hypothetical protein
MSAELALRQINGQPQEPSENAATALVRWAQAAQAAHTLATSLVKTSFVPREYRNKADEATAAILAGAEIGLSPLAALRAFNDVAGTTAPKAITLVAVAQSRGHHIEVVEESDERAVVRYRRKGERDWKTASYSVADAARAGLAKRNPNWQTQPRAMCVARASSIAARRVASDAVLGIAYSAEELADSTPMPEATPRVTVAELGHPGPAGGPVEVPGPPATRPRGELTATAGQVGRLIGKLRDLDVESDEDQRAWFAAELGRPVEHRHGITRAEFDHLDGVLDVLIAERGDQPGADE